MTQRPKLFGAVVIDDGLVRHDALHAAHGGRDWIPEYGSPDRPADLRALLAYSPLQRRRKPDGAYPPTLLTAGDHDEVVAPAHSYKFAASLQRAQAAVGLDAAPRRLRRGLRPGIPTSKQIALDADRLTFLATALHLAR